MRHKNEPLKPKYKPIPTELTEAQAKAFILPYLSTPKRGPHSGVPLYRIFNYILKVLHTGMQWHQLPIQRNVNSCPEIHYTRIFRIYQRWCKDGSLEKVFEHTVDILNKKNLLDLNILHGDGSSWPAKKGGDNIGYSGHKHFKGEKVVAIVDRNVNVIAPYITAPGNKNECPLLKPAFVGLKKIINTIGASLSGSISSWDGAYDSKGNRTLIFNTGMKPNIPENKRNRTKEKRGRKRFFSALIFKERFRTIERLFAWEDKFKRLLLRFEHKSVNHFGLKRIAYSMINLRHFGSPISAVK